MKWQLTCLIESFKIKRLFCVEILSFHSVFYLFICFCTVTVSRRVMAASALPSLDAAMPSDHPISFPPLACRGIKKKTQKKRKTPIHQGGKGKSTQLPFSWVQLLLPSSMPRFCQKGSEGGVKGDTHERTHTQGGRALTLLGAGAALISVTLVAAPRRTYRSGRDGVLAWWGQHREQGRHDWMHAAHFPHNPSEAVRKKSTEGEKEKEKRGEKKCFPGVPRAKTFPPNQESYQKAFFRILRWGRTGGGVVVVVGDRRVLCNKNERRRKHRPNGCTREKQKLYSKDLLGVFQGCCSAASPPSFF